MAQAAEVEYSATPLHTKPWAPCPAATATKAECEVIVAPRPSVEAGIPEYEGSGELGGLDPADLRSAYKLPEKGGSGTTIAIVDAYNDPNAESDLNVYRKHYGLPECTEGNGCFKKVNASGETKNYPPNEWGWSVEISLDLDMVSAACQECHILLVEASGEGITNLGAAEEEAVKLGASAISNSWNIGFEGSEPGEIHSTEETTDNKYFNHPGIPILFSGGDYGYAVRYPAVSQYVAAVGGTTLKKAEGTRGWSEEVWSNPAYGVRQKGRGTGSGCSKYEVKPKWQTDTACAKRIETDVAAVADWEKSPLSIYDSYELSGWETNGGTSASSPFVAGVEGLSTSHAREVGAEAFYTAGSKGSLFDVTKGSNGTCTPPSEDEYWCTAKTAYDGPTGWGTPNGVFEVGTPPTATTKAATSVTESSVSLNGSVNPNGSATTYYFEYGTTTSYGTKTAEKSAGSGTINLEESQVVTGLSPGTTYHYRIVAANTSGTTNGKDATVKTPIWAVQESPSPMEGASRLIGGVSCKTSTSCVAVGNFNSKTTSNLPLGETWNGVSWSFQELPRPTGDIGGSLEDVSCSSTTACTAVGTFMLAPEKRMPIAERWNGTSWTLQEPPIPKEANGMLGNLDSVSCTSSELCTAIGKYTKPGAELMFVERWNGKEWSIQESPGPKEAIESDLEGVSCTSSTACTAIGDFKNSLGKWVPLAETWNGTVWSPSEPPGPAGAKEAWLFSVSCGSSASCEAVGYLEDGSEEFKPLAERWNGTSWSVQEPPSPKGATKQKYVYLYQKGVSCISAISCEAVGYYFNSTLAKWVPLAELWNGTSWSVQEPPIPKEANNQIALYGVSCTEATVCTATGEYSPPASHSLTLVERYQ